MALNSVEKDLQPGEQVTFSTRMSFVIFIRTLILLFIVFSILSGLSKTSLFRLVLFVPLIILLVASIKTFTRTVSSAFVVTDRRVLVRSGIVRNLSRDVLNTNISGVTSSQGIFGKVFNYGSVSIRDAGGRSVLCPFVRSPTELKNSIHKVLEESKLIKGSAAYVHDVRITPSTKSDSQSAREQAPSEVANSFCTNCGVRMDIQGRFCGSCGFAISS